MVAFSVTRKFVPVICYILAEKSNSCIRLTSSTYGLGKLKGKLKYNLKALNE